MEHDWSFLVNPFKSVQCSHFVNFAPIFRFSVHAFDEAKADDPKYQAAYTLLNPMLTTYEDFYAKWLAASGPAESSVEAFNEILREESSQIHLWNQIIESSYLNTTLEWKEMFPNKFSGFYTPTTDEGKVLEVKAFIVRTKVYPEVLAASTMAFDYHKKLDDALTLKSVNARALNKASIALRDFQDTVADELYGVLGVMMELHRYTPLKTGKFFDLENIRSKKPSDHITLKVNEYQYFIGSKKVINLPVSYNKRSIIKIRVYTGLHFRLFTDVVITPTIDKVPLSAKSIGEKGIKEFEIPELGASSNPYLMACNDGDEDGMIVITVKKK